MGARLVVEVVVAGTCLLLLSGSGAAGAPGRSAAPGAVTARFRPCPGASAAPAQTSLRPRALVATDLGYDLPVPAGHLVTRHVADLDLPDGQLAAGDGYTTSTGTGLDIHVRVSPRRVTAPVVLSVLDSPTLGPRVAFVELRLGAGRPVRWDEDTRLLIGTDGGDGGFVTSPAWQHPDLAAADAYLAASAHEVGGVADPTCLLRYEADGTLDGVLFATGIGDGGYPTVLGRDEDGRVVSVVSYGLIVPWALSGLPGTPPHQVVEETSRRAAHPESTAVPTADPTVGGTPRPAESAPSPSVRGPAGQTRRGGAGRDGWIAAAVGYLLLVAALLVTAAVIVVVRGRRRARHREVLLRALGHTGALTHRITVPPGPAGAPGEQFTAPSLSTYCGVVGDDGCRSDASIVLSPRLSRLLVVCFGPVQRSGSPDEHLHRAVTALQRRGVVPAGAPYDTVIGGEPVRACQVRWPNGQVLTEHRFAHHGWLFGVGVLRRHADTEDVDRLARAVLDTWTWLDAPPDSSV